jgi:hypothetical protein
MFWVFFLFGCLLFFNLFSVFVFNNTSIKCIQFLNFTKKIRTKVLFIDKIFYYICYFFLFLNQKLILFIKKYNKYQGYTNREEKEKLKKSIETTQKHGYD